MRAKGYIFVEKEKRSSVFFLNWMRGGRRPAGRACGRQTREEPDKSRAKGWPLMHNYGWIVNREVMHERVG